ncbi:metal-dependent hydrolase [Alicyclobacillus macrosporangiidus]|uniref:Inner membrane protein n=1 Tax=Alicyclobacillus macrosporangiidus TaxID=392015 RepID=A0A1I7LBH6_9BACL|nr:metal-dependent hydrolase [Alicyclobacillus macrosporangiidus]SFV06998.1 inner membrane protein [Alicyclobacillus macrosporangiidus]
MLGRTHMGIGAVGAVAATPLILHSQWEPIRQLLDSHSNTIPYVVVSQVVLVGASMVGALIPDLEQSDSLMARKIEVVLGLPVLFIMAALIVLMHQQASLTAWGLVLLLTILFGAFGAAKNTTRILGLGVITAGLLYLGWHKQIPVQATVLLVAWTIGAMFAKHRTFTHSLIGLILFAAGVNLCNHLFNTLHIGMVGPGLIVGYTLHLVADAVAGGVPLLWPWGRRFGIRWVHTGGIVDSIIGGVAFLGFVVLAVV